MKGWAVERAAAILTAAGPAEHSVNGGGDVQCSGDRLWRIGIADPLHPGRLALVVTGRDFAVATSGVAERREHIIDPYTGLAAGRPGQPHRGRCEAGRDGRLRHGGVRDGICGP